MFAYSVATHADRAGEPAALRAAQPDPAADPARAAEREVRPRRREPGAAGRDHHRHPDRQGPNALEPAPRQALGRPARRLRDGPRLRRRAGPGENDATAGNTDVMQFLSSVATDQIWFRKGRQRSGGQHHPAPPTSPRCRTGTREISTTSSSSRPRTAKTLLDSKVQELVSAMAAFAPPALGQTSLPANYQTTLLRSLRRTGGPDASASDGCKRWRPPVASDPVSTFRRCGAPIFVGSRAEPAASTRSRMCAQSHGSSRKTSVASAGSLSTSSTPDDQQLVLSWLQCKLVRFAEKSIRFAVKLDKDWDNEDSESATNALARLLTAPEQFDPLVRMQAEEERFDPLALTRHSLLAGLRLRHLAGSIRLGLAGLGRSSATDRRDSATQGRDQRRPHETKYYFQENLPPDRLAKDQLVPERTSDLKCCESDPGKIIVTQPSVCCNPNSSQ